MYLLTDLLLYMKLQDCRIALPLVFLVPQRLVPHDLLCSLLLLRTRARTSPIIVVHVASVQALLLRAQIFGVLHFLREFPREHVSFVEFQKGDSDGRTRPPGEPRRSGR